MLSELCYLENKVWYAIPFLLLSKNVTIAKEIWQWCIDKQIWLTAVYIPGTKNVEADRESSVFADNKE